MVKTRGQVAKVEPDTRVSPDLTRITCKEETDDLSKELLHYTDHEKNTNKVTKRSDLKKNNKNDNLSVQQAKVPEEEDEDEDEDEEEQEEEEQEDEEGSAEDEDEEDDDDEDEEIDEIKEEDEVDATDEELKKMVIDVESGQMSMREIGRKFGICPSTVIRRYQNYKNDTDWSPPKIPSKHQKIYKKHTDFILSLYNKSEDYTHKEITDLLNAQFPDLKVTKGTVIGHIKKKMNVHFKSSRDRWVNKSRKLYDHHTQFIAKMLKEQSHLSLSQMRLQFLEAYPGMTISKPTFQHHVANHLKELYENSESSRKYQVKKYTKEHVDFIRKVYEKNPRAGFTDIFQKLARAYPDIGMNINGLNWHIREYHTDLYETMIKGNFPRRKLYPEHSEFLLEYIKNNPKAQSSVIYQALLEAFPTLVVKRKSMDEHIRIKLRSKLRK